MSTQIMFGIGLFIFFLVGLSQSIIVMEPVREKKLSLGMGGCTSFIVLMLCTYLWQHDMKDINDDLFPMHMMFLAGMFQVEIIQFFRRTIDAHSKKELDQ